MPDTLQMLVLGDIHADLNALGCILASAKVSGEKYDMVVCTGDFGSEALKAGGRSSSDVERRLYGVSVRAVMESLAVLELPVVFVPGNHDSVNLNTSGTIHNVDLLGSGTACEVNGWQLVGVGGSPWTPLRFGYEWNDANLAERVGDTLQGGPARVWLTHSPPWVSRCDLGGPHGQHLGSRALRNMMDERQPRLLLCGHIHEGFGCEVVGSTVVLNAGAIHDLRSLRSTDRSFHSMVYSYFSVVLGQDETITVANFMHAPGVSVKIQPFMWYFDGKVIEQLPAPESLADRAWID